MIAYLRGMILHDFWLKLFSFALATLIWLTVHFAQSGEGLRFLTNRETHDVTYYNVPVQALVTSSGSEVRSFKMDPSVVAVTIRGDKKSLEKMQVTDIRVLVDLRDIEAARGLRKRIEVTTPPGTTCVQIVPDEVEVIVPEHK